MLFKIKLRDETSIYDFILSFKINNFDKNTIILHK